MTGEDRRGAAAEAKGKDTQLECLYNWLLCCLHRHQQQQEGFRLDLRLRQGLVFGAELASN